MISLEKQMPKTEREVEIEIVTCINTAIESYQQANLRPEHEEPSSLVQQFPFLEQICRGLAEAFGFYEGVACLAGITEQERLRVRDAHLRQGKQDALRNHSQTQCPGCNGSQALKAELETN